MDTNATNSSFNVELWRRRLRVALGIEPADVVIAGGTVVNVFSGELVRADVAIVDGYIAGVGIDAKAAVRIDAAGLFIAPSFIDAHIHLESALVWPTEFARAVVPHGTGLVVTDPHEIANVAGLAGIDALRRAARGLPLHVRFTVPSCVPASEHESPGAHLEAARDLRGARLARISRSRRIDELPGRVGWSRRNCRQAGRGGRPARRTCA